MTTEELAIQNWLAKEGEKQPQEIDEQVEPIGNLFKKPRKTRSFIWENIIKVEQPKWSSSTM